MGHTRLPISLYWMYVTYYNVCLMSCGHIYVRNMLIMIILWSCCHVICVLCSILGSQLIMCFKTRAQLSRDNDSASRAATYSSMTQYYKTDILLVVLEPLLTRYVPVHHRDLLLRDHCSSLRRTWVFCFVWTN